MVESHDLDPERDDVHDPGSPHVTGDEVEAWAAAEGARRRAWVEGPTEGEKRRWSRLQQRRRGHPDVDPDLLAPTADEVDEWAEEERRRRRQWLAGPSARERREWLLRETDRRRGGPRSGRRAPTSRRLERLRRESELAAEGLFAAASEFPFRFWDELVRAGEEWEDDLDAPPTDRRITDL